MTEQSGIFSLQFRELNRTVAGILIFREFSVFHFESSIARGREFSVFVAAFCLLSRCLQRSRNGGGRGGRRYAVFATLQLQIIQMLPLARRRAVRENVPRSFRSSESSFSEEEKCVTVKNVSQKCVTDMCLGLRESTQRLYHCHKCSHSRLRLARRRAVKENCVTVLSLFRVGNFQSSISRAQSHGGGNSHFSGIFSLPFRELNRTVAGILSFRRCILPSVPLSAALPQWWRAWWFRHGHGCGNLDF